MSPVGILVLVRVADVELPPMMEAADAPGEQLRIALTAWIDGSRGRPRRADPEPAALVEAILGALESRCFHDYLRGRTRGRADRVEWLRGLIAGPWPRLGLA
jgi:hypothetical protein